MFTRLRIVLLAAGMFLLAAAPAGAETFDYFIFTHCPSTNPMCGFASQEQHRGRLLTAVQNMNLEWERVGISFHPVIFNIQQNDYYGVTRACEGDVSDEIKARRQEWRANVAALYPHAISVLLTTGGGRCCSHIPGTPYGHPEDDAFPALFGQFCSTDEDSSTLGPVLAHEMGHYFCLVHTQTFQDPATHPPTPDHDLDAHRGISDTPADPAKMESFDPNSPGGDVDEDGNSVDGHEWCSNVPEDGLTDDLSPHRTVCPPSCWLSGNGGVSQTSFEPATNMAMSYYKTSCHGPYVVNGVTSYAFSDDSVNQIRNVCIPQVPERASLPDVCLNLGGDTDHDGICQYEDNCPQDRNTSQADRDGDGVADACDLCPDHPEPTGDMDGDGAGDICDADRDGDTCIDFINGTPYDDDPDNGHVLTGYAFNAGCGFGVEPTFESAGLHHDTDQWKSCEDFDDDNDGICDGPDAKGPGEQGVPPQGCQAGPDPCPVSAGMGCYVVQGSPTPCPPSWMACLGGSCSQFFLKIVSVINPANELVLDRFFQISNRKIYAAPLAGNTLSQMGNALLGDFADVGQLISSGSPAGAGAALGAPAGAVRLEIWSRKSNQRVAIVGQFDPSQVSLGDLRRGVLLELTPSVDPTTGAPQLSVAAVYGHPPDPVADTDADGRPDVADNCLIAGNFLQEDADGDGFGDVCDADIDGDLQVTDADLVLVAGCFGADLDYSIHIAEPGFDDGSPGADAALLELKLRCGAMDLNDDRLVTPADYGIAEQMQGGLPGPASKADPVTGCSPANCDDGLACTHDYCDAATAQCVHLPGSCDDGNPCTNQVCNVTSGQCELTPVTCDDGNACTRDLCDQAAGGCHSVPETDGLSCNDASACTTGEVCLGGQCGGGTLQSCDDGNPCTVDSCNPVNGTCKSSPVACNDDNPCTIDTCTVTGGTRSCSYAARPNGTLCNDLDRCTPGGVCNAGQCAIPGGDPCNDGDFCTTDVCDPLTGGCENTPISCDDGDACTLDLCGEPGGPLCTHLPVGAGAITQLEMPGPFEITWFRGRGVRWNLYRGTIPATGMATRPSIYDHVCHEAGDFLGDGPSRSIDPGQPGPGQAFYYLAAPVTDCAEGSPGFDSSGAARPNPHPCIAPGA